MGYDWVSAVDYLRVISALVEHTHVNAQVVGKVNGASMLDTAKALKDRKAAKVLICCTFGLFTNGLEKFDDFYNKGYIDCVITTNLNYRTPELLKRDWYVEADMSKFIAAIINSLNHNASLENALTSSEKIQQQIRRYNEANR